MITAILGVITGLGGHRTDRLFTFLEERGTPRTWWLHSRYGVGVILGVFVFFVIVVRKPWRDEATAVMLPSFVFVGVGTLAGCG